MTRVVNQWFRALGLSTMAAGGVVFGVACSEDDPAGAPSDIVDGGSNADVTTIPTPGQHAATPTDAGSDAAVAPAEPVVLPLPTTGHARLFNVLWAPDGSIYGVGQASSTENPADLALLVVKLTSAGALDTTFGGTGYVIKNVSAGLAGDSFRGIVLQTEGANAGKIVLAGAGEHDLANPAATTRDVIVVRLNANGTADDSFGTQGVQRFPLGDGTAVQQWGLSKYPNDDLLVTGARAPVASDYDVGETPPTRNLAVLRLNGGNGALSTTFGQDNDGVFRLPFPWNVNPRTATILADGTALVATYRSAGNGGPPNRPVIAKLTTTGTLDPSWGTDGVYFPEGDVPGFGAGAIIEAYGIVAQGTKFVTTGYGKESSANTVDGWVSLRLTSTGALDSTYGTNGHVFFSVNGQNANSRNIYVLPDNRVVLLGGASPAKPAAGDPTQSQFAAIAVLTADGQPDPTFSAAGPKLYDLGGPATGRANHFFWAASASPDHKTFAVVGIKGGVTANADAGVAAGVDQSVILFLPATN